MGNGCSSKRGVVEPIDSNMIEDRPRELRLSPSIENLVESIVAKRLEIHHQGQSTVIEIILYCYF